MEPCLRPATLLPNASASETTLYSKYKECGQQKCRFGAQEGCTTVRVAERLIFGDSGQRIGFKSRHFLFACRPCAGNSLFCFLSPVWFRPFKDLNVFTRPAPCYTLSPRPCPCRKHLLGSSRVGVRNRCHAFCQVRPCAALSVVV